MDVKSNKLVLNLRTGRRFMVSTQAPCPDEPGYALHLQAV